MSFVLFCFVLLRVVVNQKKKEKKKKKKGKGEKKVVIRNFFPRINEKITMTISQEFRESRKITVEIRKLQIDFVCFG